LTNQLRAVLLERGVILPKRGIPLRKRLDELTGDQLEISPGALKLLQDPRRSGRAWIDGSEPMTTNWPR